jgi:glycosyltransferase involved in cell wall biosynthesis
MPVYNKEKYINKSINSVLTQTFGDFELIIIDDGSIDGTGKSCDQFAQNDSRVKVYHIKNGGVSNARNLGIDLSTGNYLYFMDADDYLDNTYLEEMVGIIKTTHVELVLSGFKKVNEAREMVIEVLPMLNGVKNKADFLQDFAYEQVKTGLYGYAWNKFVKADMIKKNLIKFDANVLLAEDYLFWIQVYKVIDKIYFCQKSYYNYLQEAENSSSGKDIPIDYFTQIMIVLQAKLLLRDNNAYMGNNKKWLNYQLSNFIFCFAYHQKLDHYQNYKTQIDRVLGQADMIESISLFHQALLNKIVLILIKIKCGLGLFSFLKTRDFVRTKYRNVGGRYGRRT